MRNEPKWAGKHSGVARIAHNNRFCFGLALKTSLITTAAEKDQSVHLSFESGDPRVGFIRRTIAGKTTADPASVGNAFFQHIGNGGIIPAQFRPFSDQADYLAIYLAKTAIDQVIRSSCGECLTHLPSTPFCWR